MRLRPWPACALAKALQSGKLPTTDHARALLAQGLRRIADDYPAWSIIKGQLSDRELSERFSAIAAASDVFTALLNDDPQLQIASVLTGQWPKEQAVDFDMLRAMHRTIVAIASLHAAVYAEGTRRRPRRSEPENWLLQRLFDLAREVGGSAPAVAAPLYRYMTTCHQLLGVPFDLSDEAFLKRAQRLWPRRLARQRVVGLPKTGTF